MGVRQDFHQALTLTWEDFKATMNELTEGVEGDEILFLFGILPGLLLTVEFTIRSEFWILAEITRSGLWLDIRGQELLSWETLVDTYISSIAHSEWKSHLQPNLTSYLICMTAFYPMAILSRRKERVVKLILLLLLATPPVTTIFSFMFPMGPRTIGFSGVLSAFFGLLPVVMFTAIDAHIDTELDPFWSGLVIFLVYASILVYHGSLLLAGLSAAISLVFLAGLTVSIGVDGVLDALLVVFGLAYLPFLWAVIVSSAGAVGMYANLPPNTNVVAHIAGYMFGFIVGFLGLSDPDAVSETVRDWV